MYIYNGVLFYKILSRDFDFDFIDLLIFFSMWFCAQVFKPLLIINGLNCANITSPCIKNRRPSVSNSGYFWIWLLALILCNVIIVNILYTEQNKLISVDWLYLSQDLLGRFLEGAYDSLMIFGKQVNLMFHSFTWCNVSFYTFLDQFCLKWKWLEWMYKCMSIRKFNRALNQIK